MRINNIQNTYKPNFKSLRTDKNQILTLKTGEMPISDNKRENILAALNNMSNNSARTNIEFLLDIAENLNYGQNGNSEFKELIDKDTEIDGERENINWVKILSDTINKALKSSSDDVSDLITEYHSFFDTKQPLTPEQKEIIELRNKLRHSIITDSTLDNPESLTQSAEVSQNLDYFISSSEISLKQKKECLEKFTYLLSNDYHINPQLKDKKVQVMYEMLTDMLIKTPGNKELTTKPVNQLYSGICAAISICRKAIAYENKSLYMDIVLEELQDSPTMEIYDVTDLQSGKKVTIPKIDIDYNSALNQGYRILDASAHIWMNNAHAGSDGTIQTEIYTAFDDENFGVFNDSSWYEGMPTELSEEKTLLRNLIKENEFLEAVLKTKHKAKEATNQITAAKKQSFEDSIKISAKLSEIFAGIYPQLSEKEINDLKNELINFYKGTQDTNEQNISSKLSDDIKEKIIVDFIQSHTGTDEEQLSKLKEKKESIRTLTEGYIEANTNIEKLQKYNSKKGKYLYYRRLFNLAAAHRLAVESDINLKDGAIRYEKISGLPPRDSQIISHLKKYGDSIQISDEDSYNTKKAIYSDMITIQAIHPASLDEISSILFGKNVQDFTLELYENIIDNIKNGNYDLQARIAQSFNIKNDRTKVINAIEKKIKNLNEEISDKELQEHIRTLGFEDRMQMMSSFITQLAVSMNQGISEEQYNELKERLGSDENIINTINQQISNFNSIAQERSLILQKWNVPSSRELILDKMEKTHYIMSKQKLAKLKSKFDDVRKQTEKNDSIENTKEREKANSKLYEFNNEETELLTEIEKSLPDIKKYCKTQYRMLNEYLFDDIERQYAYIGMLNGQFWVREEGSSGLSANEQIRIIEQMTGKPYHIERDIENASKLIKKGDGSGIISYSVDDGSYAFHAQYVPSITLETLTHPITGDKEIQEVLWTDNSWGKSEKQYFWNGKNGFNYTDYGNGYGWKNGFMLSEDMKIGQSVKTIKSATGIDSEDNEKFGLFLDMVLPGMPNDAYRKLYKMFRYIITMDENEKLYNMLESSVKQGYKINPEFLEGLDSIVEAKSDILEKQIEQIKSKEDYDKLPDNSYLKFIMETLALYVATQNPELAGDVLSVQSIEEINEMKDDMFQAQISEMGSIVAKSDGTIDDILMACSDEIEHIFDKINSEFALNIDDKQRSMILNKIFYDEESMKNISGTLDSLENHLLNRIVHVALDTFDNEEQAVFFIKEMQTLVSNEIEESIRIKSLKSTIIKNSPVENEFIAAVDKYLNPKSDEDLLDLIIGLQNADYKTANEFFDMLTPEDVALNFKDPYEYIKLLQNGDSSIRKAFNEVIATNSINSQLSVDKNSETEGDDEINTPEEIYRYLYVKLSDMDVQKYIKDFKAEAFQKYKVRPAFPEPAVLPDEAIEEAAVNLFKYINNSITSINGYNYLIEVFNAHDEFISEYKNSELLEAIKNKKDFPINSKEDKETLQGFIQKLTNLRDITQDDESLNELTAAINSLIEELSTTTNIVNGEITGKAFNSIEKVFSNWEATGTNLEQFAKNKAEDVRDMKEYAHLMIYSNITPTARDEATRRINKIISMMRKGKSYQDIEAEQDDFVYFFIDKHITKTPTILLKECIKLIQQNKTDSPEYEALKSYLNEALKVAQQTKIQYKLVQNAHEGISSKIKDLLPLFKCVLEDGSEYTLDSEIGMIYLIEQLRNEPDDHATLKLFLNQSGLSPLATKAIINNFDLKETEKYADDKFVEIKQDISDLENLISYVVDFMEKSKIKFTTIQDTINNIVDYLSRKPEAQNETSMVSLYIEYLNSLDLSDNLENAPQEMVIPIVSSIHEQIIEHLAQHVNSKIESISDMSEIIANRKLLLDIIEIPEDSDEYKEKISFINKYEKTQEYIKSKLTEIQNIIESSDIVTAEYVE